MKPKTITLFDFVQGHPIKISREIASIEGDTDGVNVVFIGGMHGNEPTGVLALHRAMAELKKYQPLLKGNIYALAGNLTALERGERYIINDLNRVWQEEMVDKARRRDYLPEEIINEVEEQIELWEYIDLLMTRKKGTFIFIDLHTTSSPTIPFITMSDTIMNRRFAKKVPVPIVIGVEEYVDEPLLGYVNEMGYIALAFEGGQHHDPEAVRNHEAMIWLSLVSAGIIKRLEVPKYKLFMQQLWHTAQNDTDVYEIRSRQNINAGDRFEMNPDYSNFQKIKKGEELAKINSHRILAPESGLIFMPLYQQKGSDGFFIIRKIAGLWLAVSFAMRALNCYKILRFLPGVRPFMKTDHKMVVNKKVAKWYSKELLHLMGYRKKKHEDNLTMYIRRKYDFKGPS